MDRARFDALARLLATGGSRRGALGALLSVTLLGQHPDTLAKRDKRHRKKQARGDGADHDGKGVQGEGRPGAAHKHHHRKKKTQRRRRRQRRQQDRQQDRDRPGGADPGDPCADPGDCADRLCETKTCTDLQCVYTDVADGPSPNDLCATHCCQGACCAAGATECNPDGLCCVPNCTGRQCGPDGCGMGGTCGACPPGEVCAEDTGQCSCDGARCADTCCAPGQICDQAVDPPRCCTPEPRATTCPVDTCGEVRNNCGEVVDCGRCVEVVCFTGTCHADTHRCTYAGDPNGQPGTRCPAPRVCCADRCCPDQQVCDERGIAGLCCTPEPRATTCAAGACGEVTSNCGQAIDCGACPPVVCQTGTCSASDHQCHYTADPDQTACTLPGGGAGICRGGACVVNACRTIADCVGGTANACTEGICTCGGGPACQLFADEECCGASPGGTCVDVETDPANCGGCNNACPPGVCGAPTCTHQMCGTAPAPDNSNPGNFCPEGEVCCSGACTPISTDPNDCGTCGHRCPRPSLPCQLTVCNDGVCGFENVPNGEPGGSCTNGVCCNGECCSNPTPVCDNGVCRGCSIFGLACSPGRVCCDQSPNGDNGQCLAAMCCPDFSICSAHDQCCSGTCNSRCCVGGGIQCDSDDDCCSGICRLDSDGKKYCA